MQRWRVTPSANPPYTPPLPPPKLPQIRRRLILSHRHQQAVRAQHVVLLADDDMLVVGRAGVRAPLVIARAAIAAGDRPGTRERVVDDGDLVAQHVRSLVEADALAHDGLLVRMEGDAARVVDV